LQSANCRELIRGAGKGLETYREEEERLANASTLQWDFPGFTIKSDVAVPVGVVGIGVGTAGNIDDGAGS